MGPHGIQFCFAKLSLRRADEKVNFFNITPREQFRIPMTIFSKFSAIYGSLEE